MTSFLKDQEERDIYKLKLDQVYPTLTYMGEENSGVKICHGVRSSWVRHLSRNCVH